MEFSDVIPHMGRCVDDLCLVRSMHTGISGHETGISAMNTGGDGRRGRPAMGSWLVYGLGSENDNLPAYLVLRDPASLPVLGAEMWQNTWLPSACGGTVVHAHEPRIANLQPPGPLRGGPQKRILSDLDQINRRHLERHPGEADLAARLRSYSLAAGMQVEAREVLDISGESKATQALYGIDDAVTKDFGTRCLIARRLVERGVRFVQIYSGGGHGDQNWDAHGNVDNNLNIHGPEIDKPIHGLISDLAQRGLLDETLVLWVGEFGHTPKFNARAGRDHWGHCFSIALAGGGVQGGVVHGESDDRAAYPISGRVEPRDLMATVFHCLGYSPDTELHDTIGRPLPISRGRVIEQVL